MRKCEKSHPWISFQIDLQRAPQRLLVMLGECQAACEHIARVPLGRATAAELYRVYLAKGVNATTAIEGNTLSEAQVRDLLDNKLELPASQEYLGQEVANIVGECNRLLEMTRAGETPPLTRRAIEGFNSSVLENLALGEDVIPGVMRKHSVGVGRYRGAPAEDCAYLVDRLCEWLNSSVFEPPSGMTTVFAILKAVLAHLYLAWIHPFGDGNGRTARLIEHQILLASNVPSPATHLLSNHYNRTRTAYLQQLDRASGSGGDVIPFLSYAVQGFLDGLREQLAAIQDQQLEVAWRDYVHEFFKDKTSPSDHRRRRLLLDLSQVDNPVPLGELPDVSPRLAREYANRTSKTVSRDVNMLVGWRLVEKTKAGYRARREIMRAYLPERLNRDEE